ncbi:hypothetical protein DSO57_1038958 [Entomophthora muscae]|uniref:Uncharacterized protein n=2 Tax=Entomophthora muscae TaxID=34485 RepID=A0ACC2SC33_9FUNG|nr:hypothetical protein DSO57_1038958 [Entomophthora muscae]
MDQWVQMAETGDESELEPEILIRQLAKKPGWKEANFQVISKMFKVVEVLATRCGNFSAGCASLAIAPLVDKLGDIKLKKPASEALDAISERLSLRFVLSQSCPVIAAQKSPKVLGDSLLWLKQCLNDFGISGIAVRPLVDFTLGPLASSNVTVRTNAVKLLAELRMYVGPEIRVFVQDVNPQLLAMIDAEFAKVGDRSPPTPTKGKPANQDNAAAEEPQDVQDMQDELFPRVDISSQINSALLESLASINWKERKEGLDTIAQILKAANNRIKPSLGDLLPALKARLEDKNLNLVVATLDLLGVLAEAVGKPYDKLGRPLVGPICSCINNPKPQNRTAAIGALSKMADAIGLGPMLSAIAASLTPESPLLRKDLLAWLSVKLPELKPSPADQAHLLTPVMLCLSDKSSDVRKSAQTTFAGLVESVGVAAAKDKYAALKPAQQSPVNAILDGMKGAAKPTSARPPSRAAEAPQSKRTKSLQNKPSSPKAAEPVQDAAPILTNDPRQKEIRLSKEKAGNWVFESPSSELSDSLRDACANHFSADLIGLLFSTGTYRDRDYLAAMTQLEKELNEPSQIRRNLSVSDLLLRYITIRLHDQGSTMLIKCLDLLQLIIRSMEELDCPLTEAEAFILLPSLIARLGLNNETLRKRVKELIRQICHIYSSSGVFTFLLEHGLRAKNARTRTEALDELGGLIQRQGMSITASPAKAFPAVATLIADRDAGVRNAAIAAILQAYILVGEKVYKYLGPLSDKDRGYLEERFKRTKTLAAPKPVEKPVEEPDTHIFSFQRSPPFQDAISAAPPTITPPPRSPSLRGPTSAPFSPSSDDYLTEPIQSFDPAVQVQAIMARFRSEKAKVVQSGLQELEKLISGSVDDLVPHASFLLEEMCWVFDTLIQKADFFDPNFSSCIRTSILAFLRIFETLGLTTAFSSEVLRHTVDSFITCLLDQKVKAFNQAQELSRHLNVLLVRLLTNANLNAIYEAIFQLILNSMDQDYLSLQAVNPEAADAHLRWSNLVMKCSWKLARRIALSIRQGDLDIAQLLGVMNNFFIRHPPVSLKRKVNNGDTIAQALVRTLNTILYSMCEVLHAEIFMSLQFVPQGSPNDHLTPLINKMLERIGSRQTQPGSASEPPSDQDLHIRLDEIIARIDNSQTSREGTRDLYAFQEEHPNYIPVIEEQLELRGHQFRTYVQRALDSLKYQSAASRVPESSSPSQYLTPEGDSGFLSQQERAAPLPERHDTILDRDTPSPPASRHKTVRDLRSRLAELRMANGGPLLPSLPDDH